MKKTFAWLLFFALLGAVSACKSKFEIVRTSGNPDLILQKAFEYYEKEDYQRAITLFDLVLNQIKGKDAAEKAYFQYAYAHYHTKQFVLSAYYFKNFSNTFTNSPYREEAAFMSAYSNYQQSPSFRLEQSNTLAAIDEFQTFVNLFPESKRVPECNELIDECRRKLEEKAFAEGELYYNTKQYQAAVISFDNLLKDYPESPDAERVRYLIVKSDYLLSQNSVVDKKIERYSETVARCDAFLEKYPKSGNAREVKQIRKDAEAELKELRKRLKTT
ncbi:MAG: outer membrane protein assembly factor BamD [Saprospiraceae bacterium]|nr:outer membrane protein assembly factor BamD [Saprospiraceae bacterium]